MKHVVFFVTALVTLLLNAVPGYSQWQKTAVTEARDVSSKGELAPFTFSLPAAMDYWVHTTGNVNVSNSGDKADGHYYISGITLPSGIPVPVGLKMRTSASSENFLQITSSQAFKASNDYVDRIASSGSPLTFRFFDRDEPGAGGTDYYADNNGNLHVEVSQMTPEMIVQYDTLDYDLVPLFTSKDMLDSIQGFGKEALRVSTLEIIPIIGGDIYTINSERGYAFSLLETTNQLRISARPVVRGPFLAHLRIVSPNALGGNKIIVLKGRAPAPDVRVAPGDTIDFGLIPIGGTSNRTKQFNNVGEDATSITGVTISQSVFSAVTPLDLPVNSPQDLQFAFSASAQGLYEATADVHYAHGGSKQFFLIGRAGMSEAKLSTQLIDFGTVLIGDDSITVLELSNLGALEYTLNTVELDNAEFSFVGPSTTTQVTPKGKILYQVAFHPTFHQDPYHEGKMTFKFAGMSDQVVILRGRDQSPIASLLKIDTNYYYRPGEEFTVYQRLLGDLSNTVDPVRKFTEFIIFDKEVLEIVSVKKADLIASNDWSLASGQNGGAIDITLSSNGERLRGPGRLLELRFKVRETVLPGTVTEIRQEHPDYYTASATLAEVSDGKVHVLDRCDPIMTIGADTMASFIEQNRPNPFNPVTSIPYHVGSAGHVKLELYNSAGELVGLLIDGQVEQGFHVYRLDAASLPSGIYSYVFTANGKRTIRRMTLVK